MMIRVLRNLSVSEILVWGLERELMSATTWPDLKRIRAADADSAPVKGVRNAGFFCRSLAHYRAGRLRGKDTVVSTMITDMHIWWGDFISIYRCRIVLPEELMSIAETDLWECHQKTYHYRYRFSLQFQLDGITEG